MTNEQLYLVIGVPLVFNTTVSLLLFAALRSTMTDRFNAINQRFDDMRGLWLAELHRVEEVIDARLKHLEERDH